MAKTKTSRIEVLRSAHTAFLTISQEIQDFSELEEMAEASGNAGVIQKMKNAKARYATDYETLANKRSYIVGKLLAESPALFNEVLNKILEEKNTTPAVIVS